MNNKYNEKIFRQIIQLENAVKLYENNNNFNIALEEYKENKEKINTLEMDLSENCGKIQREIDELNEKLNELNIPTSDSAFLPPQTSDKALSESLIKLKIIEKTKEIYSGNLRQMTESLLMIKEDMFSSGDKLLQLMSMKENIEQIINQFSSGVFKNLIVSYNQIMKESVEDLGVNEILPDISIEKHEVLNVKSLPALSKYVFSILSTYITSLKNNKSVKSQLFFLIQNEYQKLSKDEINKEEFIFNISKNIKEIDGNLDYFLNESKFAVLLKYIIKCFGIDKSIEVLNEDVNDMERKYNDLKVNSTSIATQLTSHNIQYKILEEKSEKMRLFLLKNKEKNRLISVIKALKEESASKIKEKNMEIRALKEENCRLNREFNVEKVGGILMEIKRRIEKLYVKIYEGIE